MDTISNGLTYRIQKGNRGSQEKLCVFAFLMFSVIVIVVQFFFSSQAGLEGVRCLVSSPRDDLGFWYSQRHGCWRNISVHFYHSQLSTGTMNVLFKK